MSKERWKQIEGYDNRYWVSDLGRVKNKRKVMAIKKTVHGYYRICLYSDGKQKGQMVHRLVLGAFVGACPDGMETRHLNGVNGDNHVENLVWGTRAENIKDKMEHGAVPLGAAHSKAKLTDKQVLEIREKFKARDYKREIVAAEYGVSEWTIQNIRSGQSWKHLLEKQYEEQTLEIEAMHEL